MSTETPQQTEEDILRKIAEDTYNEDVQQLINDAKKISVKDMRNTFGNARNDPANNTKYTVILNKDQIQSLMYNIVIFHYLIEMKIIEINNIKLDTLGNKAIIIKLIKEAEKAVIIKKTPTPPPPPPPPEECPSFTLKIQKQTLTDIDNKIQEQSKLLETIKNMRDSINNLGKQTGGEPFSNNEALNQLREISKTTMINSAYNVTNTSENTYQAISQLDSDRINQKILKLDGRLDLEKITENSIQPYINALNELVLIYQNLHLLFVNQVELLLITMKTGKFTIDKLNKFLIDYKNYLSKQEDIVSQGGTEDDCVITVPDINVLQKTIDKYKPILKNIVQMNIELPNDSQQRKKLIDELRDLANKNKNTIYYSIEEANNIIKLVIRN